MKILAIIPARYGSTRFPGKLLADLGGQTVIERVYRQVKKVNAIDQIIVATDHQKIIDRVNSFSGHAIPTSSEHKSGTDRCVEALKKVDGEFDYVINIQGDEPFIDPGQINTLIKMFDGQTEIATLIKQVADESQLFNPNVVKVVKNSRNEALYFSRSNIPYIRGVDKSAWLQKHTFYKHLGIYGYRCDVLKKLAALPMSRLEQAESLEQLRWLENGYKIMVGETSIESIGIDTPEDLEEAKKLV